VRGQFRTSSKEDWRVVGECLLLERAAPKIGLFTHGGSREIERWVEIRNFVLLMIDLLD
jgi:hypothetical protein